MAVTVGRWRTFAVLGLLLLLAACDKAASDVSQAPPPRPVQVQRVTYGSEDIVREYVGVVRARHETDIGFRIAGKLIARTVSVGDRVNGGEVVAQLDSSDLDLQLDSAKAELDAAKSNLAQASTDESRYANLRTRGSVPAADYEHKQVAKDEAIGRLQRAQRAVDLARHQLDYAELRADVDGVIIATPGEPGQVLAIGQTVMRIADRGEKEALVSLPESSLEEVRRSTAASAQLWSAPGRSFAAHLRELSPQADPATRTYAARFTLDNADETVALGMTVTVRLTRHSATRIARLPLSAILNRGSGPNVYRVKPTGALELQPVTVAAFDQSDALVTGGIADGDEVVTLGVQKLVAGEQVRPIEMQ